MLQRLKYRILPLIMLAMMILSLCSCTLLPDPNATKTPTKVTIDDLMQKQENQNGAAQEITKMESIKGEPSAISGKLLLTAETTVSADTVKRVQRVYNLETGKLLATIDDARREVGFVSAELKDGKSAESIYYVINDRVMYVYNADGSQAIAANYNAENDSPFGDTLNGFSFDGTEYYVRDGVVVYEGDNPLASDYFNASVEYLGRHYYLEEDEAVFVFDSLGKPVYEFHRPSYAEDCHIFVLGNGNVFVQYTYETIEGEEYDYIRNAKEHKIVSIFANLERNTVTEPVIGYLVNKMENAFTDDDFDTRYTDRVDNVALIMDIDNKRIDENAPQRYIVLSDNLIELFSMQNVVQGALDIIRISYDRNLVKTASGNLLVAGDGTVIGQLNNYRCITEKYILTSGKIYNHDLEPLFDLVESGYTYRASVGDNIILSKVVGEIPCLYLFTGKEPVFICEFSNYVSCFEGYAIREGDIYHYYDDSGKKLITTAAKIEWMDYYEEADGKIGHVGYAIDENKNVSYFQLSYYTIKTLE